MERIVAIKKLGKLLGKGFGYRIDREAPTPEERAAAKAALGEAVAERNKLQAQRDERYRAILAADGEYQSLRVSAKIASDKVSNLQGTTYRHKFTVGTSAAGGLFFHVAAEGDSWEEVIDKVSKKQTA